MDFMPKWQQNKTQITVKPLNNRQLRSAIKFVCYLEVKMYKHVAAGDFEKSVCYGSFTVVSKINF